MLWKRQYISKGGSPFIPFIVDVLSSAKYSIILSFGGRVEDGAIQLELVFSGKKLLMVHQHIWKS